MKGLALSKSFLVKKINYFKCAYTFYRLFTYSRIVRTISEVKNMGWGFGSCGCSYGGYSGYGGYGYGGYGYGGGSTFVLIVVLFILLIIVGASFYN
jgi:uncharacterized protein (TIGR01732 family)